MRNPGGYLIIQSGTGTREYDTFTCAHCNSIVIVRPKQQMPGGYCTMCSKPVCNNCSTYGCTPFERQLDLAEKRDRLMRSVGI